MQKSLLVAALLAAFAGLPAHAEEEAPPNFAEDTLSGDWGGARSAAAKNGILLEGGLKVDTLRNRGGMKDGTKSVSHLDLKAGIDLEKAAGWSGGSALVHVISDSGRGPGAERVGNLMGVTNIEVPFPTTTRLFQAWVQQSLFDDGLAILAGLYPIDTEFFTMDSAGLFLGPQYGTPADLALTRGPSIFNNSAFGVRTKAQFAGKSLYAMWAILDGVPNDPNHPKRTTVRFDKGDGAFNIAEVGWLPEAHDDKYKGHAKFALGVWGYTARADDQLDLANIEAGNSTGTAARRRSRGGYFLGERTLLRFDEDRYLSLFARYTWTDGDSTPLRESANIGINVKGPLAARPDDNFGIAFTRAGVARKYRDALGVLGGSAATAEDALEITYRIALTPWLAIQPNLQYVRHPGGEQSAKNAKLIGARFEVAL